MMCGVESSTRFVFDRHRRIVSIPTPEELHTRLLTNLAFKLAKYYVKRHFFLLKN